MISEHEMSFLRRQPDNREKFNADVKEIEDIYKQLSEKINEFALKYPLKHKYVVRTFDLEGKLTFRYMASDPEGEQL